MTTAAYVFNLAMLLPLLMTAAFAGDSLTIGPRFQHETSLDESGFKGKSIERGRSLPLYKEYPEAAIIKLPPARPLAATLGESLSKRASARSFSDRAMALTEAAALLNAADGITHTLSQYALRSAPSGGALYPIELYLVASRVDSLQPGIYHFRVVDSSLEAIRDGEFGAALAEAAVDQEWIESAPIVLALTARFERSTQRYADRGYRYTYIEAGAICQNIYLAATALAMGTTAVGAFYDDKVNEILNVDGREEAALLLLPVGYLPEK